MRWAWIDQIVEYEPGRRLVAIKNISRAEEYLFDHLPPTGRFERISVMPASLMIEGMAQTAGILTCTATNFREKVILAKVARARFERDAFPGHVVRYDAVMERIDDHGAATAGTLELLAPGAAAQWQPLGRVDLMFSHLDRNLAGAEFPRENFVLTEMFRTIIRDAGLEHILPEQGR